MNNMQKKDIKNTVPDNYETPNAYVFGWILLTFSLLPAILGLVQKIMAAFYTGIILLAISLILLVIGKFQSKKLIEKLRNNK